MKWKNFLIGAGIGLMIGYTAKHYLANEFISPNTALANAKKMFKEKGSINGSWIYTIPQTIIFHDVSYTVYKVGISRTFRQSPEQYEVYVDARTGEIVKIEKLN